jgi:hypothetical protein
VNEPHENNQIENKWVTFTYTGKETTGHSYRKTEDMKIIKVENKGKHLDTLEKYHIFCSYKQRQHLNDNNIDAYNPIFNAIYKQHNYN